MLVFCSFTIVIDAIVKITSAGFSLVLLISNRIVKVFLKIRGRKKNQRRKIALLARITFE